MKYIYTIIFFVILGIFSIPAISNANVTYTPGKEIALTGSNNNIRFDVHEVIKDEPNTTTGAKLLIDTTIINSPIMTFTGAFYMSGIGWGLLQTGSYQVGLNCGTTVDFSILPNICHLTGSGWSELIGELGFSGAEYYSASGTLSGSIRTNFGVIDLDGIYLPLLPASFTIDLNNTIVNHNSTLSITGSQRYRDGLWELKRTPKKDLTSSDIYIGSATGIFIDIDISLADNYIIVITDPDGGTTEMSDIKILSGPPSLSIFDSPTYLAKHFCSIHGATDCPDGTTLKETRIIQSQDATPMIGDGISYYHFLLKSRDQYGNAINTGSLQIHYITTAKANQLDYSDTSYPTELLHIFPYNAIIHSGTTTGFSSDTINGESESLAIDLFSGQDIRYSFASIAPTDTTDSVIRLKSIVYTTHTGATHTYTTGLDTAPLIFNPWFTVDPTTTGDIFIGEEHGFNVAITNESSRTDIVPQIYSFLSIGNNLHAAFRDFTADKTPDCQAYKQDPSLYVGLCDWASYQGEVDNSIIKISHISGFLFTGTYSPLTKHPIEEDVNIGNIIYYTGFDTAGSETSITYHYGSIKNFGKSLFQVSNIKILGSNNGGKEYGGVNLEGSQKTKFFDTLRQKISLLSRNRKNYDDVDYMIVNGDYTANLASFSAKKTIIVIGGNVTIEENITRKEEPIALIVLSNNLGEGGVITIENDVTDLNLTLVTDRHITSGGDYQLYINGSIFSSNTMGESASPICPYYITDPCTSTEAKKYDLEKIRSLFGKLTSTTGKTATNPQATSYPHTGLIIEYDMRIAKNPPPGL